MANYVIGDVQGCFAELMALLEHIQFDSTQDRLWFTGDLVNRGPDSLAVLRYVKSLPIKPAVVLGNHDLHLLAIACGQARLKPNDTIEDVLLAPDCSSLCDWLRHQPLLHHALGFTIVHAGLAPQWDLTTALHCAKEVETVLQSNEYPELFAHMYGNNPNRWQDDLTGWMRLRLIINYLTRIRFCDENGTLELNTKGESQLAPAGFFPWYKIPNRAHKNLKIIFGHWAALGGQTDEPGIYALDTGCVWGNALSAMRLEDQTRFSVPCAPHKSISSE